jgi:CRISPR type III-A-associated RAMP protein Csm5
MEHIAQCLSPIHIGTGRKVEPFDYVLDNGRYIRVNIDAVAEYLDTARVEELTQWLSDRADRMQGVHNRELSNLRGGMNLLEFAGDDAPFRQALLEDPKLALYSGRTGMDRNSQVIEQVKEALGDPLLPGSSLKGSLRTALAFQALRDMSATELRAVADAVIKKVEQAEKNRQRDSRDRVPHRIGQLVENAIFRCGQEKKGRDDINYDLMRLIEVADSQGIETELIVPQVRPFVEGRTRDRQKSGRLEAQVLVTIEACAPGSQFRVRIRVNARLLREIARQKKRDEWVGLDARVAHVFGPATVEAMHEGNVAAIEQAVIERIGLACRAFAGAIIEEEVRWSDQFAVSEIRTFYGKLQALDSALIPLRLGWGSHFMTTTLLLALRHDPIWQSVYERMVKVFDIGLPPGRGRQKINWKTREIALDSFPSSRRMAAAGRRPIAPLGWLVLSTDSNGLPGSLVDTEALLTKSDGPDRRGSRSYDRGRSQGNRPADRTPEIAKRQSRTDTVDVKSLLRRSSSSDRGKGPQVGQRISVEIVANDNRKVTVRVLDNQDEELSFNISYYPQKTGAKVKMRIVGVDASTGRITRLAP